MHFNGRYTGFYGVYKERARLQLKTREISIKIKKQKCKKKQKIKKAFFLKTKIFFKNK